MARKAKKVAVVTPRPGASPHAHGVRVVFDWIDRVTRAIDAPGMPGGLGHDAGRFRERLQIFREGVVIGSLLSNLDKKRGR
ncbi:MAG TPA: hypothetical protein VGG49_13160 [Steroidobacteraceae bacterium]